MPTVKHTDTHIKIRLFYGLFWVVRGGIRGYLQEQRPRRPACTQSLEFLLGGACYTGRKVCALSKASKIIGLAARPESEPARPDKTISLFCR